ncbi:MAG: hypothetical protein ICV83_34405, partial [Cytophagales bacterium]|nr:hypothetical protein [Cytophagales bacterium]
MQKTFATLLASDDYLPGVLVLHQSLKKTGTREGFLVLVTPEVSPPVLACLAGCGIPTRPVAPLESPYAGLANPAYLRVFTKLRIFELVDYQKVVYLDTDMLVCAGIDALFEKPAWSAVNAGGMLPEKADWVQLNAGLLVVAPDADVFREMAHLKDILPSSDGGDQGFLQAYRPQWPDEPHLHLDHAYNLFVGHADRYARLFGYHLPPAGRAPDDRTIRVLHF